MKIITVVVPGRPVPAVRMTQRGKFVKDRAQLYLNYKKRVGWYAKKHFKKPINGPVEIKIKVYVSGKCGDWDNYAKTVCDSLNKIAYHDDCQVKKGTVEVFKCSKNEQRLEFEIREAG